MTDALIYQPMVCSRPSLMPRRGPVVPGAVRRYAPPHTGKQKIPLPRWGIPRGTIFDLQPTLLRHANDLVRYQPNG